LWLFQFDWALTACQAIYFSMVTMSTVGYGDLAPTAALASNHPDDPKLSKAKHALETWNIIITLAGIRFICIEVLNRKRVL